MSDPITELRETLLGIDNVTEMVVRTRVTVTHRTQRTGETDECFYEIRERAVPEDEFESLASDLGWDYHGTIDVPNEFYLKDRFSKHEKFEVEEDE